MDERYLYKNLRKNGVARQRIGIRMEAEHKENHVGCVCGEGGGKKREKERDHISPNL